MKSISISRRITLIVVITLVLCTSIIGIFAYKLEYDSAIELNAQRALAITDIVSSSIDTAQFSEIMSTLESNEYHESFLDFLEDIMKKTGVLYLYILDANYGSEVTYFGEAYISGIANDEEEVVLGDTETIDVYSSEMFDTLRTGVSSTSKVYNLGGYGEMISAFSPISNDSGRIIGVVGVDIALSDVLAKTYSFGLMMIIIVFVMCLITAFIIVLFVKKYIGKPVSEIAEAAGKLSSGDVNIKIVKRREDEIGLLADAFSRIADSTSEQAKLISRLADGDLTVNIVPRGESDTVNKSLTRLTSSLNDMIGNISASVEQVNVRSKQIADGSQTVAQGSAEQASSIEELSGGIGSLTGSLSQNAEMAAQAAELSSLVKNYAEKGSAHMEDMVKAVSEIGDSSRSIEKVISVIDDLAFQTNILALNAAVEAAHAGQHGKGFAVVAEEVRNLAGKSAEAAKNTRGLISDSMEKAALGSKIAQETSESLVEIVDGVNKSADLVDKIARSGSEQARSITEINRGITEVSNVVTHNSSAALDSAAASEEMRSQADILRDLVAQFKVRDELSSLDSTLISERSRY